MPDWKVAMLDHFITLSYHNASIPLRELREITEAWGLHFQCARLEQGRFSATYLHANPIREISTWDVGYFLLDWLREQTNGEDIEIRLCFSSFEGDEALLTSREALVELPCTCNGKQASIDLTLLDQQCAWETETLGFLPHMSSLVSAANPKPWTSWLPSHCEVRGEGNGVIWYGNSNCNYLLFHGHVIENYGYHGERIFKTLQCYHCRRRQLRQMAHTQAILRTLLA